MSSKKRVAADVNIRSAKKDKAPEKAAPGAPQSLNTVLKHPTPLCCILHISLKGKKFWINDDVSTGDTNTKNDFTTLGYGLRVSLGERNFPCFKVYD